MGWYSSGSCDTSPSNSRSATRHHAARIRSGHRRSPGRVRGLLSLVATTVPGRTNLNEVATGSVTSVARRRLARARQLLLPTPSIPRPTTSRSSTPSNGSMRSSGKSTTPTRFPMTRCVRSSNPSGCSSRRRLRSARGQTSIERRTPARRHRLSTRGEYRTENETSGYAVDSRIPFPYYTKSVETKLNSPRDRVHGGRGHGLVLPGASVLEYGAG